MVKFSEVVAISRDAQLQQNERELADLNFLRQVMDDIRSQVEAEGGELHDLESWSRLSEYALNAYQVVFPAGCNLVDTELSVGGRVLASGGYSFMVGPVGAGLEPTKVQDRGEAVDAFFAYLMEMVQLEKEKHER